MLQGKAKTDYQREYMRRRRAGQASAKTTSDAAKDRQIAALKARIAELRRRIIRAK
jgi:hypothetical protein